MFATKLFEMLGVKGIIVILFAIIMAIQGFAIVAYRERVTNLKDEVKNKEDQIELLNGKINLQNAAIQKFEDDKKKSQTDLDNAKKTIVFLDKKGKELVDQLSKVPTAISCTAAVTELKSQNSIIIKDWNKK